MSYAHTINGSGYRFADLKTLLAKASPARSGDYLAGIGAASAVERMAARLCLAEVTLAEIVNKPLIPYELDEVTRLICDRHAVSAFAEIAHFTVGDFRNWLLLESTDEATLARIAPAITPECAAAVSKLMRNSSTAITSSTVAMS